MQDHRKAFQEEAYDLLQELEGALLELEESPDDSELIGRVFRAMHTIKGSGSMFGFDALARFTHDVETVFDLVRDNRIPVTKPLLDMSLEACDIIRKMIDDEPVEACKVEDLVCEFQALLPHVEAKGLENNNEFETVSDKSLSNTTYRILFRPDHDIFATGTNPLLLINELKELGDCIVCAHTGAVPFLGDLDPESCLLSWDIILTSKKSINDIKDVFIFVEDECDIQIDVIDEEGINDEEAAYKKLGEILIERSYVTADDFQDILAGQKRIGELLVESRLVDEEKVEAVINEQQHVRSIREKRRKAVEETSIKVPSDRLDKLVDLVGELVISQERLNQMAAGLDNPDLTAISEEIERMTAELRDNTMSIRMVPIGSTFTKFKRLIRDLSSDLNKDVVMVTDGGDTELDKTVIERLNDPLVHIIRNSIDHGIETPDIREASGKPRQGTIHLSAMHSGANVLIRIKDDGAGLDKKAIFDKAVQKNLIEAGLTLSDAEIYAMIFEPGFSTAQKITGVSGRGVGMDVVKRNIESLSGNIEVNSETGSGTLITIKLPLTLAIIDGLMVKIGDAFYVMPLSAVEECIELTREQYEKDHGRHMVNIRGEIVPYIRLRETFEIDGRLPDIERIVIAEVNGKSVGFAVDQVLGEYQTVIKNLGRLYRDIEGLSGATILGDGTVALILDLPKLVSIDEKNER